MNRLLRITVLTLAVLIVSIGSFSAAQARPANVPPTVSLQGINPWNFCTSKGTRVRINFAGMDASGSTRKTNANIWVYTTGATPIENNLYYSRNVNQAAKSVTGTFIIVPEPNVQELTQNAPLAFPLPSTGVNIVLDLYDVRTELLANPGDVIGQRLTITNYRCSIDNDATLPGKTSVTNLLAPYTPIAPIT